MLSIPSQALSFPCALSYERYEWFDDCVTSSLSPVDRLPRCTFLHFPYKDVDPCKLDHPSLCRASFKFNLSLPLKLNILADHRSPRRLCQKPTLSSRRCSDDDDVYTQGVQRAQTNAENMF